MTPQGQHRAGSYPTGDYPGYDMPTDPHMPAPLNVAPQQRSYQDLVVPRVFLEPDEYLDRLRQRALKWAIARDVLAVVMLLIALGWVARRILIA